MSSKRYVDIIASRIVNTRTEAVTLRFNTDLPIDQVRSHVKAAVADFIQTKPGEACLRETNGTFGWKDAILVPNEIYKKHGLELLSYITPEINADLGESLLPEEY